jgi:hypothetical protein
LFAVNVKLALLGFVIFVPNVIVYAVAQLVTLSIYVCQSLIVLGAFTVKFALGVIVLDKSSVTLAQVNVVKLKSAYFISHTHKLLRASDTAFVVG